MLPWHHRGRHCSRILQVLLRNSASYWRDNYINSVILTRDCIKDSRRQPPLPSKEINAHRNSRAIHVANASRHVSLQRPNIWRMARNNAKVTMCSQQQLQLRVIHGGNISVQPSTECSDGSCWLAASNSYTGSNACNVITIQLPPALLNRQQQHEDSFLPL